MKKAKKILLMAGAYILTTAIAIGGTVAYLQSEDSDVNVMTLGNVKIEQHEYERVVDENGNYTTADIDGVKSYELKEFTQEKPLYPIVGDPSESKSAYAGWDDTIVRMTQVDSYGSMQVFAGKNAQDKFVTVENVGKTDAYIRTIVAIEIGSTDGTLIGTSHHNTYTKNNAGTISIDGNNYMVIEYMYAGGKLSDGTWRHEGGVLPAGDTSYPSLSQVYLKHNATNEDMEKIDGDKNGTLDIIVLSQATQTAGFENAQTALDTAFGKTADKAAEWFGGVIDTYEAELEAAKRDVWDGTADTSWYNDTDTEFTLTTAEQFAGFGKIVNSGTDAFENKSIILAKDLDLSGYNFTPIGGFDKENAYFAGTLDGNGHTIFGLTENGWELGYKDGETSGMGLFGLVYNATIKDVTIDNAEVSMESVVMGVVAGYANGDCTFEEINVTNTKIANYNWDTGGIVGQVYGSGCTFTFKDIVIDESTTISGHWGTWDVSAGGVIGRTANGVNVIMEDITVAAELDVYNDVCAAYQWYAYRYSGMLVGYTKTTETVDGRTIATAPHVTCKNVTVIYGDWANYTYCQASNVAPQFVRVQGGYSTDPYYSGRHWTAGVDAAGNKMVDDNHIHAEGEAHNKLIVFDQLFGGGQGVYGNPVHEGVTVVYNNK